MTLEKLKRLLPLVDECARCGFCANDPPTREEIVEIITELIEYKSKDVTDNESTV